MSRYVETNLEPCETPEMEIFMQRVNSWKPLTIFAKTSIFLVWHGCEYACEFPNKVHPRNLVTK